MIVTFFNSPLFIGGGLIYMDLQKKEVGRRSLLSIKHKDRFDSIFSHSNCAVEQSDKVGGDFPVIVGK